MPAIARAHQEPHHLDVPDGYAAALAGEVIHLVRQHGFHHPGEALNECFEQGNRANVVARLIHLGLDDDVVRTDLLRAHAHLPPAITAALATWEITKPAVDAATATATATADNREAAARARVALRQLHRLSA